VRNKVSEHDVRINAILDAQIRNEDRFAANEERFAKLAESLTQLAESQAHSDRRIDALIDLVRQHYQGNSQAES
jgi:hypothetical protein